MQSIFERKTEAFIGEQKLIVPGERVLVGLSGGADSTCLFVVLCRLSRQLGITLGAFHVNHGIRGAEAERDEAFSEALCRRFGSPFFVVRESVPERAKEWGMGVEEAGRRVRYEVAERLAQEQGYDKIALAHHRNDVAETLLFHLFRGSSVNGLASIPVKRGRIIRPLLHCTREEIEAYLEENAVAYCTDATNEETAYTRNKIRHRIVAYAQKEINAGAVSHMAEAAAELSEVEDFLAKETEAVCACADELPDEIVLPVSVLKELHSVLKRRVIYQFVVRLAGSSRDITKEHVSAVLGLLENQSGKRVSLPYGLVAGREFERIYIKKESEEVSAEVLASCPVAVPGTYPCGTGGESLVFRLFSYKKNTEIPKNEYTKWFDYDKIRGTLCLRTYCEGDRLGMQKGSKSLKALWTEHKIPVKVRRQLVILADEAQVLWVPGVRSCDNYRIDESTKTVLEVRRNGGRIDGSEC